MGLKALLAGLLAMPLFTSTATAQELSARYGARFGTVRVDASFGNSGPSCSSAARGYRRGGLRSTHFRGRAWVPGRYVVVQKRVWIPGRTERVWVDPVYDVSYDDCGNEVPILVREGFFRDVFRPGHFVLRDERVWQPGYWARR